LVDSLKKKQLALPLVGQAVHGSSG